MASSAPDSLVDSLAASELGSDLAPPASTSGGIGQFFGFGSDDEQRKKHALAVGGAKQAMGVVNDNFGGTPGENTANGLRTAVVNAQGGDTSSDAGLKMIGHGDNGLALGVGMLNTVGAHLGGPVDPKKNANFDRLDDGQKGKANKAYKKAEFANDRARVKGLAKLTQGGAKVGKDIYSAKNKHMDAESLTKSTKPFDTVANAATAPLMGITALEEGFNGFKHLKDGNYGDAVDSFATGADRGARGVSAGAALAEAAKTGVTNGFAASAASAVPMVEGVANAAMTPGKFAGVYDDVRSEHKLRNLKGASRDNISGRTYGNGGNADTLRQDHIAAARGGKANQRAFERRNSVANLRDAMSLEDARKYGVGQKDIGGTVKAVDAFGTAANAVGSFTAGADMGITKGVGVAMQSAAGVARVGQMAGDRASAVSNAVDATDVARGYDRDGIFSKAGKWAKARPGAIADAYNGTEFANTRAGQAVGAVGGAAWDATKYVGKGIGNSVGGAASLAGKGLKLGAKGLGKGIKYAGAGVGAAVKGAGWLGGKAASGIKAGAGFVADKATKLGGYVADKATTLGGHVADGVQSFGSSAAGVASSLGSGIADRASAVAGSVRDFGNDLGTGIDNAWENNRQNPGFGPMAGLKTAGLASLVAGKAVGKAAGKGAGKLGRGIGKLGKGIGKGIGKLGKKAGKMAGKAAKQVGKFGSAVGSGIATGANAAGRAGKAVGRGAMKAVGAVGRTAGAAITGTAKGIGSAVGGAAEWAGNTKAGEAWKDNVWNTRDMKWARKAGKFMSLKGSSAMLDEANQEWDADAAGHVENLRTGSDEGAGRVLDIEERLEGNKRTRYAKKLNRIGRSDDEDNRNMAGSILQAQTGKSLGELDADAGNDVEDWQALLAGKDLGQMRQDSVTEAIKGSTAW